MLKVGNEIIKDLEDYTIENIDDNKYKEEKNYGSISHNNYNKSKVLNQVLRQP